MGSFLDETTLGRDCTPTTHCASCKPDGSCDYCETIEGRFMEAVNEYASTCDYCGDLCSHDLFEFLDERTQLGACGHCLQEIGLVALQAWVDSLPGVPSA